MYERCSVHELYDQKGRLSQFLYEGINEKKGRKGEDRINWAKAWDLKEKGKKKKWKGDGKVLKAKSIANDLSRCHMFAAVEYMKQMYRMGWL